MLEGIIVPLEYHRQQINLCAAKLHDTALQVPLLQKQISQMAALYL